MDDSESLTQLASQATALERSLHELLVRRRFAPAEALPEVDEEISRVLDRRKVVSEQAAAITE